MAYATYTTKALVCGTFNRNTADRSYLLFTREAGMLYADARSVRKETSRQRYALQDFSLVRVSLVKGKVGWKIGSVEALINYYSEAIDKSARGSVVSLFRMLRRFVKGEEPASDIFDYAVNAFEELIDNVAERHFVLMAVELHILSELGYVDMKKVPEPIIHKKPKEIESVYDEKIKNRVENLYSNAISVSHL